MKRIAGGLFSFLFLIGTSGEAAAQLGVDFGVRGGVSVASASFDLDTFDPDNRTGFVGGPFLNVDLGIFGVQVAALYHQMGFEDPDSNTDLEFTYFEIPAIVKIGVPLPRMKPSIFGGVALGYEGSCEINGADCADGETSSTQYAGVAGADVALYLGNFSLWADGRYNFGVSDVFDEGELLDGIGNFKHRAWNFTVGLGFRL